MSNAKRIVKNTVTLFLSEVFNRFLSFLLVIFIARYLGDVGLGKYSFIFAFVGLFVVISDFGVSILMVRDVAKNKLQNEKYFRNILTLKLIFALITLALPFTIIQFLNRGKEIEMSVLLASIATSLFYLSQPSRNLFTSFERQIYQATYLIIERLIAFSLGILVLYLGYGLIALISVFVLSNLVSLIYAFAVTSNKFTKIKLEFDFSFIKKLLKKSIVFWFSLVFITIYFRIDTVMLSFMKGYEATGWYNAAYKIIDALTFIPFLVITAVFPAMSRFHKESKDLLKLLYEKSFYYLFIIALPLSIGTTILAKRIIIFVFKDEFINSVVVLQILIWALLFMFINYIAGYLLNSIEKQKLFTISVSITAVVNIILNFILIPLYSYIGASIATVISEILTFAMLYYFTSKNNYRLNFLKLIIKPFFAAVIMSFFIIYFSNLHILLLVPISIIIYFASLFIFKALTKEEVDLIRSLFTKS